MKTIYNRPATRIPQQQSSTEPAASATTAGRETKGPGRMLAVLRISTGFVFLWAFLDKLFGWGYATTVERAWVNGGSPTKGFLSGVAVGPFESFFHNIAGDAWANWLFMLALAGVGIAVILGIGLRVSAVAGSVLMLLMWAAEWPLDKVTSAGEPSMSTNPIMDYHILYALVLIVVALTYAGSTWGFGKVWSRLSLVRRFPWLI